MWMTSSPTQGSNFYDSYQTHTPHESALYMQMTSVDPRRTHLCLTHLFMTCFIMNRLCSKFYSNQNDIFYTLLNPKVSATQWSEIQECLNKGVWYESNRSRKAWHTQVKWLTDVNLHGSYRADTSIGSFFKTLTALTARKAAQASPKVWHSLFYCIPYQKHVVAGVEKHPLTLLPPVDNESLIAKRTNTTCITV